MDQSITFKDIKKNNYSLIYQLLYQKGKLSKQEIANQLHLSLPTVSQNLVRLEDEKLIEKSGQFKSSVGRRATAYSICSQSRVSIGVEIQKKTVRMLALDLHGVPFKQSDLSLPFSNEDHYYKELSEAVKAFISSLEVEEEYVLGVGFAVQALTSIDGQKITYGKILNCTGLEIDVLQRHLNYPCMFMHDAKSAATTELWVRNNLGDAVYLSIGMHLGGAVILNGEIYMGKEGHGGTVEHMTINPDGPSCYCGKTGCMETYSSVNALLEEDESLESFFKQLRAGSPSYAERWEAFLNDLAFSINNIHLVLNREFIIGGHLSPYLTPHDLERLHEKVNERSAFPNHEPFIYISQSPENGVPIGAALPYIQSFINSI
ncbi:ROK family transcriptional regulator [Bacillus sp. FJAT-27251]|uniref:ROK family transcriptional regulator n=1 Tax=Bacillus sp. FJAT-27251 TaxID=1684142 RepID=UPI0006A7BC3B|nr:ROK family transcriptional regulator [Bacillus sp. FJAT-27251]